MVGWFVEYEGNHAFCQYCGLLGHTIGLCRKKREVQGKAKMDEGTQNVNQLPAQNSQKIPFKGQWVAKDGSANISQAVTTNNQNNKDENQKQSDGGFTQERVTILKKSNVGANSDSRRVLLEAGLISPPNLELSQQTTSPNPVLSNAHSKEDSQYNVSPGHAQRHLLNTNTAYDTVLHPEITQMNESFVHYDTVIQTSSVLSLNKFSVLDTEDELHMAFENLQQLNRSNNKVERQKQPIDSLAIVPMMNEDACLSDGTG